MRINTTTVKPACGRELLLVRSEEAVGRDYVRGIVYSLKDVTAGSGLHIGDEVCRITYGDGKECGIKLTAE